MAERPVTIALNDQEELHCVAGPALEYRDGFELFVLNGGAALPPKAVTAPEDLTVDDIERESSLGTRRALINIYGADRYARDSQRLRPAAGQDGPA